MDAHIAETELLLFACDAEALPAARRLSVRQHLSGCGDCRLMLDFFRISDDPSERSTTLATLRAYAKRVAEEDDQAEKLLGDSRETVPDIPSLGKSSFAAGIVRSLSFRAHALCESEPRHALALADAAVLMAELLPDDAYPVHGVFELRGLAWKERANAQMLLGDLRGALESLTHAEDSYRRLLAPALGLGIVALVRAGVLYEQRHLEEAATFAEKAEQAFAHLRDDERRMDAVHLRGSIKLETGDLSAAVALYEQVLQHGQATNDAARIARAAYAIGHCEIDRGNLSRAGTLLQQALVIFRDLGADGECLNVEWGLARLLLYGGKPWEALPRLRDVEAEFQRRGMVTDAALAGLDVVEALLSLGDTAQVSAVALRLSGVFRSAGAESNALLALAYVEETARAGTLTGNGVRAVRTFLRRAERQPELLFVAP